MDLMVNTALPEDLGSMGGHCYIHNAEQLRRATIGVEDIRKEEDVEMSMLQSRQLSEILSEDGRWGNLATEWERRNIAFRRSISSY